MTLTVRVPDELSARVPVEQRGPGLDRDSVRLPVSRGTGVSHHAFVELPRLLRAGDLLGVDTLPTPAAVDGWIGHARVVVHLSTRGDDGRWAVELRDPDGRGTTRAGGKRRADTEVRLVGGARLVLEAPLSAHGERLWRARVTRDVLGVLREHGRPVRYACTERDRPLSAYRTVFALPSPDGSGSAQMPSAGRPFTTRAVTELVSRGVRFAPVTLHAGVGSAEAHGPPRPERFAVPEASADRRGAGGRRPGDRGGDDGRAGGGVGGRSGRGGAGPRGVDRSGGGAGARGAGGGRTADRAARTGGLAPADAGGGRGTGGGRPRLRGGAARALPTCGTSSGTCLLYCHRGTLTRCIASATIGKAFE